MVYLTPCASRCWIELRRRESSRNVPVVFLMKCCISTFNMKPNKIAEACVDISILDYDAIGSHALIGVTSFTCGYVHVKATTTGSGAVSWTTRTLTIMATRATSKYPLTVLGPGDEQKAHDVDREYQEEIEREQESGRRRHGCEWTGRRRAN